MPIQAALPQQHVIDPAGVVSAANAPPPLPGGVAAVMRWMFNLPSWLQLTAVAVLVVLVLAALWYAWYRFDDIARRLRSRSREWKIVLGTAALLLVATAAGVPANRVVVPDASAGRRVRGPMAPPESTNEWADPMADPVEFSSFELPPAASDTTRFSHQRHKSVACRSCHRSERTHGELAVRTERDCASCHHSTQAAVRKVECTSCHSKGELTTPRTVRTAFATSVRAEARSRDLAFDHTRHAKVACRSCHQKSPSFAFDRGCGSCHEDHHVTKSTCTSCHTEGRLGEAHPRDVVHRGCSGAGCHQDATVAALAPERNVCLTCHATQADHKPGRECATCHQVRWPAAARLRRAGGVPQ